MADIGKYNTLQAIEETDRGLMLDGGEHGLILCPSKFLPEDAEPGEEFRVFVYLDSKDRFIATTETPIAVAGDFAVLEVLSIHPKMGAFVDWGLPKDLLLPFSEQVGRVRVGQKIVATIQVDKRSNRMIASMRCQKYIDKSTPEYAKGDQVSLLVFEETPMGFNAIVDNRYMGLLYHSETGGSIRKGQSLDGFIKRVREDGRIDLTLNDSGYGRVTDLTEDIREALSHNDGFLPVGDKSTPEEIRTQFNVSKRAFKQAIGALYRRREITIDSDGIRLVKK